LSQAVRYTEPAIVMVNEMADANVAGSERLDGDAGGSVLRGWLRAEGFGDLTRSRPVIGVCSSWSELNPCNAGLRDLAAAVKRGVIQAGGLPLEFPTISIGENFVSPTSMLLRNLMSMDVEEMVRRSPIDGVVLLGGCDKTIPAMLMGAASAGKPAVVVAAGPRLESRFRGEPLVTDDYWRLAAQRRAGEIDDREWDQLETCFNISVGTCNVMGTASTMAIATEAMGMSLPGSAVIPAPDGRRSQAAERSGIQAVLAVRNDLTPSQVMTQAALDNGMRAVLAVSGSANALIHLAAIAARLDLDMSPARVKQLAETTPTLTAVRPAGPTLLSAFHEAGGVPTLLRGLGDLMDLDAVTVTGLTWRDLLADAAQPDGTVIRTARQPIHAQSEIRVLHGNLAPRGAIVRTSTATPALLKHAGPAVVFDGVDDMYARINDPALNIAADSVLILRGIGPQGAPGMPEANGIPIPDALYRSGVRDMLRVTDARVSGTHPGTMVLHVTPEAAVGGPLGAVRDGDTVSLDALAGALTVHIDDAELARRSTRPPTTSSGQATRGYEALYVDHVLQADEGCDFDFLRGGEFGRVAR